MRVLYKNLKAVLSGEAFHKKNGRNIKSGDEAFIAGPIDILYDQDSKKVLSISKNENKDDADLCYDSSGLVATAAFHDSHTHAVFGGSRWNEFFDRWAGKSYIEINEAGGGIRKSFKDTAQCPDTQLIGKLNNSLKDYAQQGVESVEVKSGYGTSLEEELRLLKILSNTHPKGVRLFKTFLALHAIPQDTKESVWVDQMITALDVVKANAWADFVDVFPEKGFFSLEESIRFLKAAKTKGFGLKLHADEITNMGASLAGIQLGALSIDHLQKISSEALSALEKSETIATLLPATSFYLGLEYAPARKILNSGARVSLATDFNPGTAPSLSIKFTAKLAASQMRMSAAEILCALTYNAASALGLGKNHSYLSTGSTTQILLWNCESNSPLEEILLSEIQPRNPALG